MLAYRKPGEPIQVAFPARYHTPELSSLLHNVTELYVPEAVVGITGACCSDHQVRFLFDCLTLVMHAWYGFIVKRF